MIRDRVLEYYFVLRTVLKGKPGLRPCLTRCRHCRIFFLTHPRNAERSDLGCPFGCGEAHRRQQSTRRSVAYYRTVRGKLKKKIQNGKRSAAAASRPRPDKEPEARSSPVMLDDRGFDAGMVGYVGMVTSLIEGRRVTRDAIVEMLSRAVRQHSIARSKRIDYVMRYLNENPP